MEINCRFIAPTKNSLGHLVHGQAVYAEARKQAALLLRKAKSRARQYNKILWARIKEKGFEDGYRAGLNAAQKHNLSLQVRFDEALKTAKDDCFHLVCSLAKEILEKELAMNPSILSKKISKLFENLPYANSLEIFVSQEDLKSVHDDLKLRFSHKNFTLHASEEIPPGNARVQSIAGSIEMDWKSHFQLLQETLLQNRERECSS